MKYLATASGPDVVARIADGTLGQMVTLDAGNALVPGATWAADNGCFAEALGKPWSVDAWLAWLARTPTGALFAVVPDVVGDHAATLARWRQWWRPVAELGHRPAFVTQDGITGPDDVPWDQAGAVFIGGSTAHKHSPEVVAIATEAHRRRCWLHVGRVNTLRRLQWSHALEADSVDGTALVALARQLAAAASDDYIPPTGMTLERLEADRHVRRIQDAARQ